mgnify:CR=1 FL=1
MAHIAKIAQKPELLPTLENIDTFLNMVGFVNDILGTFTKMGYTSKSTEELTENFKNAIQRHRNRLER